MYWVKRASYIYLHWRKTVQRLPLRKEVDEDWIWHCTHFLRDYPEAGIFMELQQIFSSFVLLYLLFV